MKFRTLKTDFELDHYRKLTQRFIDVLLPVEYLKRSKVVGVFDVNDILCGGYVIVLDGPFRVLDSIPIKYEIPAKYKPASIAEVTGLWLNSRLIKGGYCAFFWAKLMYDLIKCGKRNFVYAYSLKKSHIGRMYEPAKPTVLFRGATKILEGMDDPDRESVEIMGLKNLLFAPFINPRFFVKRYLKGLRIKRRARSSIRIPVEDTVDLT